MQKKSVFIYTYGCQMNVHDSEKMLGVLEGSGFGAAAKPEEADLLIFNTCAIRAKAEQKFYSQLGRAKALKKRRPGLKIAVAGCVAQDAKERLFRRAPFVDFALGPQNIHLVDSLAAGSGATAFQENPEIGVQDITANRQSRFKAWVSIMFGCNNFCSYCIVPYTRGREISRPSEAILEEIRELKSRGYREITLLGQNVNSYNSDIGFPELLRRIDSQGMERIRFVTSHPRDLSLDLINAIADLPAVCEHLHLPLQSGSDRILKLMNRRYTYAEYREKIQMVRAKVPGISITTDIIAGFPGEDEADFGETVKALGEIEYDGVFAFKYSPREGTKAYCMIEQVNEEIKAERLNDILKLQEDITFKINKKLEGEIEEIIVEGPSETDPGMLAGRTRTNKIVTFKKRESVAEGSIVKVRIEKARLHSLLGGIVVSQETPAAIE